MVWLPREYWIGRQLAGAAPGLAGDMALRLFCWPPASEWRHPQHDTLKLRARFYLRNAAWRTLVTPVGAVQCYIFEPDGEGVHANVLLVHGWTGEASFMTALAEPLRRAGFRVILFDLPAHGLSEGRATNLMDCARAVLCLNDELGPFYGIVTHSFGSMIALVAAEGMPPMPHGLAADHFVLVSSPNRLTDITRAFCEKRCISQAGQRAFERRLERIGRRSIHAFNVARLLDSTGRGALLIHAQDDGEVPFSCAQEIAGAVEGTSLQDFNGLGHSNILFATPVARAIGAYLMPQPAPAQT